MANRLLFIKFNKAILGGELNDEAVVYSLDLKTQQIITLPLKYDAISELHDLETDTIRQQLSITRRCNPRGNAPYVMETIEFDSALQKIGNYEVAINQSDVQAVTGRLYIQGNQQMVAGSVATYKPSDRLDEMENGFYFASIEDGRQQRIKYYTLAEVKEQLIETWKEENPEKTEAYQASNKKSPYPLYGKNYFLVHDLIPYQDHYVLIAEIYQPTEARYQSTSGERFYKFDGYACSEAMVMGVDKEGKMIWQDSYEINIKDPIQMQSNIFPVNKGNELILVCNNRGGTIFRHIKNNQLSVPQKYDVSNQTADGQEVKYIIYSNVQGWYGNYFIAFGKQRLKNDMEVFFLEKISC